MITVGVNQILIELDDGSYDYIWISKDFTDKIDTRIFAALAKKSKGENPVVKVKDGGKFEIKICHLPEYTSFFKFLAGDVIELTLRGPMKFQMCAKFFDLTELDNHMQDFIAKSGCAINSETPAVFQFSTNAYHLLLNPCRVPEQMTTSSITSGVADLSFEDMEVEIPSIKTEDIIRKQNSPIKPPTPEILNSTVSSTTSAGTDPTINPINELQEYCVRNNIFPNYDINLGNDGLFEVVCKVSTGDAKTAFHTEEKRAKILAAKEMLQLLTNEKIELEECDEFNNYKTMFVESVQYLKQRLNKRKGKGPLPLPETDPKSCFNLLGSNYPALITGLEMLWQDVGVNSHCPFFKYSGSAKITVYVGDSMQQFGTSVQVAGRHGVKKVSEKVTYAKLLIAAVKAIKQIQESQGNIRFEAP